MLSNFWIIPILPLAGFMVIGIMGLWRQCHSGQVLSRSVVYWVACGAVGLAFLASAWCFLELVGLDHEHRVFEVDLFNWINGNVIQTSAGESIALNVSWGYQLDPLSSIFILFIPGIGFLIHLYSIGYMWDDEAGFWRFFSYLNLFMFMMLTLVLSNNYLGLFVGWEGVGLCSYLLIGYYSHKKSAGDAAKKAFVVNRIGDFGFILGIFLLFSVFGTLDFTELFEKLETMFPDPELAWGVLSWISLLLFVGACGKSAQAPLYVWLPDAMEGPTPVSALIHAATMVTAGVYMVARSAAIYSRAPDVMFIIAMVGIFTAFLAASIGLFQTDIKRVLAYSTVSQLGYMFAALGVGAFFAAIFHVFTHAFFKALLFLGAGSVIYSMHHEQNMEKMGGLRKHIPVTFWTMAIGTLAIAGLPPLAGFFSKDEILWKVFESQNYLIWVVGLVVAGMTAFYMARLMILTFFGEERFEKNTSTRIHESPFSMIMPLVVLATGSVFVGFLGLPAWITAIFGRNLFQDFLEPSFEHVYRATGHGHHAPISLEFGLAILSVLVAIVGIVVAVRLILPSRVYQLSGNLAKIHRWICSKYYVDEIYDVVIVNRLKGLGNLLASFDNHVLDGLVNGSATLTRIISWVSGFFDVQIIDRMVNLTGEIVKFFSAVFRKLQTGLAQRYALVFVLGVIAVVTLYLVGV